MRIVVENLSLSFNDRNVLNNISFTVEKGNMLVILGQSGAGKTLILRCISGLIENYKGYIYYDGISIINMKKKDREDIIKKIGFVFQFGSLVDSLTVKENMELYLRFHTSLSRKERENKIYSILKDLNLEEFVDFYPSHLSGGMKKRLSVGCALVKDPQLILFDEPTTGLDPVNRKSVIKTIEYLKNKGNYTIIIVTHDMDIPLYFNSDIIYVEKGKILYKGRTDEFLEKDFEYVRVRKEYKNA